MIDQQELLADAVARATDEWLRREFAGVSDADLLDIQELFRGDEHPRDYDDHAYAFARAFHLVNYRKSLAALWALSPRLTGNVVDLGCGSGAATVAALVYLASRGQQGPITVTLVDRSSAQIKLARRLLAELKSVLRVDLEVESSDKSLPGGYQVTQGGGRLVMAAHVLTENQHCVPDLLQLAEEWAGPGGDVVVVERADDAVWKRITGYTEESFATRTTGGDEVAAANVLGQPRTWRTSWLMLSRTPHAKVERAARHYFEAWLRQEPKLLDDVFTETAQYHDKPPQPPHVGLASIRRYWEEHVLPQEDLAISFRSMQYTPTSAHIEWAARFVRDGLQRVLHGIMVLDVETSSGLISELREYYRSVPPEASSDSQRRHRSSD